VQIHEVFVGLMQRELTDADLDGNLPIRRRADENLVGRVQNQRLRRAAELRITERVPEQRMGVEKVPHGMYSSKSFRCSSSSATMVIIPLHSPGPGRWRTGGFSLTSFATGWLFS